MVYKRLAISFHRPKKILLNKLRDEIFLLMLKVLLCLLKIQTNHLTISQKGRTV